MKFVIKGFGVTGNLFMMFFIFVLGVYGVGTVVAGLYNEVLSNSIPLQGTVTNVYECQENVISHQESGFNFPTLNQFTLTPVFGFCYALHTAQGDFSVAMVCNYYQVGQNVSVIYYPNSSTQYNVENLHSGCISN